MSPCRAAVTIAGSSLTTGIFSERICPEVVIASPPWRLARHRHGPDGSWHGVWNGSAASLSTLGGPASRSTPSPP